MAELDHTTAGLRSSRLASLLAAALLSVAISAAAAEPMELAPEPLRFCVTCHGVELKGNQLVDAPRLAGLPRWYLARQMDAFRNGWRGTHPLDVNGMEMRPQALVLTGSELEAALDYATRVPVRTPPPRTVTGDSDRGQTLYATCAACHGVRGEGNELLNSPPLTGQSDWYLVTQLELFRAGARGSTAGDVQGALMAAYVAPLTDTTAVLDVVAYITSLDHPPEEP